jgi:hypothetical protein
MDELASADRTRLNQLKIKRLWKNYGGKVGEGEDPYLPKEKVELPKGIPPPPIAFPMGVPEKYKNEVKNNTIEDL